MVAGCGGGVVANWQVVEVCGNESVEPQGCPTATVDTTGIKYGGNINMQANMTFSSTLTVGGAIKLTYPKVCLVQVGVTLSCADLTTAIQSSAMMDPDSTIQSGNCVSAADGCACTMTLKPQSMSETGTYTTSGNVLSMDGATGMEMFDYCVKDSNLHLRGSMPLPMGMTMSMGIVLKK
jgi:hypothetical protein